LLNRQATVLRPRPALNPATSITSVIATGQDSGLAAPSSAAHSGNSIESQTCFTKAVQGRNPHLRQLPNSVDQELTPARAAGQRNPRWRNRRAESSADCGARHSVPAPSRTAVVTSPRSIRKVRRQSVASMHATYSRSRRQTCTSAGDVREAIYASAHHNKNSVL